MGGSLSVRFDAFLAEEVRDMLSAACSSGDAEVASWSSVASAGKTYARVDYFAASPAERITRRFPEARIDDPPVVVLEVGVPDAAQRQRLFEALSGRAAPVGMIAVIPTNRGVLMELDDTRTPLALLVDFIDVELGTSGAPLPYVRPLIGLSDRTLARFAGSVLATPDLDEARLIETYSERLRRPAE